MGGISGKQSVYILFRDDRTRRAAVKYLRNPETGRRLLRHPRAKEDTSFLTRCRWTSVRDAGRRCTTRRTGEAYEGDPISHIRVRVTEEGAVFHPYNQIKE